MNARYYEPGVACGMACAARRTRKYPRFISPDSYTGNPYNPNTQNVYAYVGNNPVNYTDPTGHFIVSATLITIGIAVSTYAMATMSVPDFQMDLYELSVDIEEKKWGLVAFDTAALLIGGLDAKSGKLAINAVDGLTSSKMADEIIDVGGDLIRVGDAVSVPTNRKGLRRAMEKLGGVPFEGAETHHGLPWNYRDWFASKGINVNDPKYGAWVMGGGNGGHQSWSRAYDYEWRRFINRNKGATVQEIESFYNHIRNNPTYGGGF